MGDHVHLSALLLPVVAGLLLEELTFGGLVRLLLVRWPVNKERERRSNGKRGRQCSH